MDWKFKVEKLGKVAHAEISMAPLVLLVGQNNTGKSYIATLAWALTNITPLLAADEAKARRPEWFKKFVSKAEKTATIEIGAEQADDIVRYLNSELAIAGADFLKDIFLFSAFDKTRATVHRSEPFSPFRVSLGKQEAADTEKSPAFYIVRLIDSVSKQPTVQLRMPVRPEMFRRVEERLLLEVVYRVVFGSAARTIKSALYIPAARTGLMLALRALIGNLFESDEETAPTLPGPITDFLRRLAFSSIRTDDAHPRRAIADWLQNEVIHGQIVMTGEEVPSFSYIPESSDISVPLHATSSMITELTPFLVLLKNRISPGLIIFEEPEAHLHLSAQRSMARAIARLLNAGFRMMVTTHSDTFVQQINNLIHLHGHPDKENLKASLGYDETDLIDPALAKAYEFVQNGQQTSVVELTKQEQGFVVPSLNETLINLAQETIALDDRD